jgi:hypothetical protein
MQKHPGPLTGYGLRGLSELGSQVPQMEELSKTYLGAKISASPHETNQRTDPISGTVRF